jgi:exonuclease SbcC
MIPVKLEIEGLYSYKEKQTVDFAQLTAAGLFGIFGAVGSGKSSILEAILLALYGSTERLSDRGEKSSMLNLQRDNLLIQFEFLSGKNNGKRYLARYAAKRNPKNQEEIRPAEHTFYLKSESELLPLDLAAEDIVGMKKEHFKQTVIIPQGKFREFIDLTPGPRAEMMKELFGLERFDLSAATAQLLKQAREEKIRLETKLAGLEGISRENLLAKQNLLQEIAEQEKNLHAAFQATETAFRLQESLRTKHIQLTDLTREWELLDHKRPEIEEKKRLWKDFLRAKTHLKPVWEQREEAKIDLEKYRVSAKNCADFKESYAKEVEKLESEEKELKKKADERPQREAKIRDLKKVIEVKGLAAALKEAEKSVETLIPHIETLKSAQKETEKSVKEKDTEIQSILLPSTDEIAELKAAAKDWTNLEAQESKLTEELNQLNRTSRELEAAISAIQNQVPAAFQTFSDWIEKQKLEIQSLEASKENLLSKQGLAAHAHLLLDGEACPLCGAIEHPNPLTVGEEKTKLEEIAVKIEAAKSTLEAASNLSQQLSGQKIRQENYLQNRAAKEKDLADVKLQLQSLIEKLREKHIHSKESLSKMIGDTDFSYMQKENLTQEVRKLRKALEERKALLEKEELQLRAAEQAQLRLLSTISAKKEEIKDPAFSKSFMAKGTVEIENMILNVQKDIELTNQHLEGKRKVLQETRARQATNLANLENFKKLTESTEAKIEELHLQFQSLKTMHGFENEAALIALFQHSLDADKVDLEIRQFEDKSLLIANSIQELKSEKGVSDYDEAQFLNLRSQLEDHKDRLDAIRKDMTLLEQEIKSMQSKILEKEKIEAEYGLLDQRENHLKELDKLFKGSGFVKYVSSIYLKELCHTANKRFMSLTKNRLSLEIDDSNTFFVRDYLNGGKLRLLKTLSGGQTFQASLCLALALAEKVKSLNQADQSFFFLDEGFGALDKDSLRVVFETLKSLRHENRIVGIISHVEELQQEVGVYAKVHLDPELGSQVGYSF